MDSVHSMLHLKFRIYLHSDSAITWDNEISFFTFGENLKTENAQINGTEIELDLSKAKLITMQTQTIISSKVNIFYFIIDTYQYRYIDTSVPNKALSYLSLPSNILVSKFHLIEYGLKKEDNKSIPFESDIANIDFTILPNLTTNPYTAVIKYHRFDSAENVIEKNNIYYGFTFILLWHPHRNPINKCTTKWIHPCNLQTANIQVNAKFT